MVSTHLGHIDNAYFDFTVNGVLCSHTEYRNLRQLL